MEISVIVQIEKNEIWAITFNSQNNCPIKGCSTRSKSVLKQVINALDVAKEQVIKYYLRTTLIEYSMLALPPPRSRTIFQYPVDGAVILAGNILKKPP